MARKSDINFTLTGIDQLLKNLRQINAELAKRAPSAAVRAGSRIIINEARIRTPIKTGSLKKSIGLRIRKYSRSNTLTGIIGPRSIPYATPSGKKNPAFYGHLVEFGTAPHDLTSNKKFIARKGAHHPGAQARPYLRPAWDAAAPAARSAVINKVKEIFRSAAASKKV